MFDETIEEIKEFLKDAKSKGAMVSCGCKLFDSRYSYYDSDLDYQRDVYNGENDYGHKPCGRNRYFQLFG